MKLRKFLPLTPLSIGVLCLLSGCDAILNALYANNTINVTVDVSCTGYANSHSFVQVSLSGASGATAWAYASVIYPGSFSVFALSFPKLLNGNYTMTTYYVDGLSYPTYYQ
jgi:hypothetical protein